LFEQTPQGVLYFDASGTILEANPAAGRILGLPHRELCGRSYFDPACAVIDERDVPLEPQDLPVGRALATGRPVRNRVIGFCGRAHGARRWLRVTAVPQWSPGGAAPRGVLVTLDDISELKEAQFALRRSEERFRAAAECASDVLFEWDIETDALEYFGRMQRVVPEDPSAPAASWISRLHPAERDAILAGVRESIANGVVFSREHRFQRADGTWIHLVTRGQPLANSDGAVTRWVGATRDITTEREAANTVQHTLSLLRAVVEGTADAVFVKDLEGRYIFVNGAAAACFGRSGEEVIGRTLYELVPREMADALTQHDRSVSGGEPVTWEADGPGPDGVVRRYLMTKAPFRSVAGDVVGITTLARDVTEMRRLEEEYRQAQKMEAIGRLAGGIAHDFNNLLTVILGYADELTSGDTGGAGAAEAVRDAAHRAAELTSQLLAFSRKQVLQPQPTDPNALIEGLERMLRRIIGEDITLRTSLDERAGTILVDRNQLEQVLVNLAVNARDAMPGGGRLTIETKRQTVNGTRAGGHSVPPGRYVVISVSDTGTGMSRETASRIFEPFYTTKGHRGTGLGLAMVHGIVKQSGGDIRVETAPGRGTAFRLMLPTTDQSPAAGAASVTSRQGGGETILVIDDEPTIRQLLVTVLRRRGYAVAVCGGIAEARGWLDGHRGDLHLVITDVVMPDGRGQEIADYVHQTRPDTRVLYMSGYADHGGVDVARLSEETPFLQKPFTPAVLAQRVRAVLEG
jgi:PAS domain S-box-containing protein